MGTLELASKRKRRCDHMMSGAADKIAGLIALNAEQALKQHSGGEGEGPDVPLAVELRMLGNEYVLVDRVRREIHRLTADSADA